LNFAAAICSGLSPATALISVTAEMIERAIEVQHQLARKGRHPLPLPDLLIAAVAEINSRTVMHYDADYDRIAEITSQPVNWVVEQGSVS
jgi:predicted nucleic acid-binding protein